MKKFFLFAVLFAGASWAFMSCNNGDYDANPNTNNSNVKVPVTNGNGGNGGSNNNFLTTGSWKPTASILVVDFPAPLGPQTTDVYASMNDCEKDNIWTFHPDKTYTMDESILECTISDPDSGTWDMYDNNTKLKIVSSNGTLEWEIVTLTNTTLVISRTDLLNNLTATVTITYSRP